MAESTINTLLMNDLVARSRLGDRQARDELLQRILHRLERLARRMLRQFSNVSRYVEWEEVLAEGTMKLLHALETRNPGSTREFFTLAAVIMRNHLETCVTEGLRGEDEEAAERLRQELLDMMYKYAR